MFIGGKSDWVFSQSPAHSRACNVSVQPNGERYLVESAGRWVQQEQARVVTELLLDFLLEMVRIAAERAWSDVRSSVLSAEGRLRSG